MSTQQFTEDQQALHDEVKDLVRTAARNKGGRKSSGGNSERTARKVYTPEHDLQILALLKEDDRAEKFGSSSTEEKKELCSEMCEILESAHDQKRTQDSLYYRISKLLRASRLDEINYRIKGEAPTAPTGRGKKKKIEASPESEEECEEDNEVYPASEAKQEVEQPGTEIPESSDEEDSDTEDFDDDDDFLE